MTIGLLEIRGCFEGVIPSIIATCDTDDVPNISYLSQVFLVDDQHVALSNQFFSKTAANVAAGRRATVMVVDGNSGHQYLLDLDFVESVSHGPVFARMDAQLRATSGQEGVEALMALRAADIYRVAALRPVESFAREDIAPCRPLITSEAMLALGARIVGELARMSDPDRVIDCALDRLQTGLGFTNIMLFARDIAPGKLTLLASRGYARGGVGAEVAIGEGVIGIAAETGVPVRISDMSRGDRMIRAIRRSAPEAQIREIALPGLYDAKSQIAVPMLLRGRVCGILFAESRSRFRFSSEDEQLMILVATQLALEIDRPAQEEGDASAMETWDGPGEEAFQVHYYPFDDSLFIDGEYIIKGLPGRLLFHFLSLYVNYGRREFSNREIRLDAALKLPEFKDNLETRLILLRRRLDERAAPVRLTRPARGRIGLEISATPELNIVPG